MTGGLLSPTHLAIVLIVALLVLGPKRLPSTARSIGHGLREFKDAISGESGGAGDVPAGPGEELSVATASVPGTQVATAPVVSAQVASPPVAGTQVAAAHQPEPTDQLLG